MASSTTSSSSYNRSTLTSGDGSSSAASSRPKEKTEEEKLLETYRGNSLSNGAQPYSDVYGNNKSNGNSEIKVSASPTEDVVVLIKRSNSNGPVVRHAYIAKGCSYTFHLPAGMYQTFFYSGQSWCPTKRMPNGLKGGFLQYESFSKDSPDNLPDYTQLTYSLTSVRNGNFSTKSSNEREMFQ